MTVDEDAWAAWLKYRSEIKKPLKPPSWALARKKMAALGPHQMAAVENSIANGWIGLFLPPELRDNVPAQFDIKAPW